MKLRILAFVCFAIAFAPTLRWIWDNWFLETRYFEHGPLLVAVCVWFLIGAVRRARETPQAPSRLGICMLGCGLLVHVAAQALTVDSLSAAILVPTLLALVWAFDGWRRLCCVAPALGCLFFAVPLPIYATGQIAYSMKHIATTAAVALGNLVGLGLTQIGANIRLADGNVLVVGDACSGLRSLAALTALGYVYAMFLTPRGPVGRLVFFLVSIPIALGANFVRIAMLAAFAKWFGVEFATGPAHTASGYVLYLAAIVVLFSIDRLLPPGSAKPTRHAAPEPARPRIRAVSAGVTCIGLILAFGAAALVLSIPRAGDDVRFSERVARETRSFVGQQDFEFPQRWYDLVGTRDVCWRRYRQRKGHAVADLTAIFQGSRWKSLHPPDVCLISAGYEIVEEQRRSVQIDGEAVEINVLRAERVDTDHESGERGLRRFLIGYAFGGRDFTTPSFLGFFLRNVPRALLRQPNRGYLLRVDVAWPEGSKRVDAERTMSAFLTDFLPAMNRLMQAR